jgi:hypothetical protein
MAFPNAITFRMPYAIPGDLAMGAGRSNVKAEVYGATAFPWYGLPVVMSGTGTVIPVTSNLGATANSIYGFLVRPFPLNEYVWPSNVLATTPPLLSVPPTSGIANVMTEGYIGVYVQTAPTSVVEGGTVYLRYATTGAGITIFGGIEGVTSGNNFAVTNTTNSRKTCYFTGPCDSNGFTVIAFGI